LPAPIGYLDRGKGKCKELDRLQAPLVRKAFEMYATGKYFQPSSVRTYCKMFTRRCMTDEVSRGGAC
jgi:hypothetical protein